MENLKTNEHNEFKVLRTKIRKIDLAKNEGKKAFSLKMVLVLILKGSRGYFQGNGLLLLPDGL